MKNEPEVWPMWKATHRDIGNLVFRNLRKELYEIARPRVEDIAVQDKCWPVHRPIGDASNVILGKCRQVL